MEEFSFLVLLVGVVAALALATKSCLERLMIPPLTGYLLIGIILRGISIHVDILPDEGKIVFGFLAKLGVISLLFGVGLTSETQQLLSRLKYAVPIWLGNILISGGLAFLAAYWLLELGLIPSVIIGTALTATSVGVSSAIWDETNSLGTDTGELFVDVAELDDISGVLLMALLFAILPKLHSDFSQATTGPILSNESIDLLLQTGAWVLLKLTAFIVLCYLFAHYASQRFVQMAERLEPPPDSVITIISLATVIAGIAGMLGFSVAIGAFFAGLALSSQRKAVFVKAPYKAIHNFFVPFFFIGIGLNIELLSIGDAIFPAVVLLFAAVIGKLLGTVFPGLLATGISGATVLGVSMIPRAEISMIIMDHGLKLGDWAVTPRMFTAMVLVSGATCLLAPPVLRILIDKWEKPSAQQ